MAVRFFCEYILSIYPIIIDITVLSAPCSPSNLSSVTLTGSASPDYNNTQATQTTSTSSPITGPGQPQPQPLGIKQETMVTEKKIERIMSEEIEGTFLTWIRLLT